MCKFCNELDFDIEPFIDVGERLANGREAIGVTVYCYDGGKIGLNVAYGRTVIYAGECDIAFCPMCGRNLNGGAEKAYRQRNVAESEAEYGRSD